MVVFVFYVRNCCIFMAPGVGGRVVRAAILDGKIIKYCE